MVDTLDAWSLVGVYSASAVYLLSFFAFLIDLARRSSRAVPVARSSEVVSSVGGATKVLERTETETTTGRERANVAQRVGLALAVVGWLVHVAATVLRGIAAERVPWVNMFEFALTGTAIIVGVFLAMQFWKDLRFLGAYVMGVAVLFLMLATANFYVEVAPLHPALQSAWIVIHVLVAALATGFFAIGTGLSILQLFQNRREIGKPGSGGFMSTFPPAVTLERLAFRMNIVGFALWTFTLIAGAIWAERAWGRYWGWDTKEVWTFVIWVVFAGYIHARATRGWRGNRSAILAIIGFAAVLFNFIVVNTMFTGLHAYSGL